jgi:hypothetical protein
MELEFFDAPQPFVDAAGDLLASDPVLGSVLASVTERIARELTGGRDSWAEVHAHFERWWLVVRDGSGEVVSAAMRTAPFKPYPTFAMPMADDAARALAVALHERGEFLGGANGALPGSEVLARSTAELARGEVVVDKATRRPRDGCAGPPRTTPRWCSPGSRRSTPRRTSRPAASRTPPPASTTPSTASWCASGRAWSGCGSCPTARSPTCPAPACRPTAWVASARSSPPGSTAAAASRRTSSAS